MDEHADEFGDNLERAEEAVPEVYEAFLSEPCEALGGKSPKSFFEAEKDACDLVDWLCEYYALGIPIPDILTERIVDLGKDAEFALVSLFRNQETDDDLRMICISALRELDSILPMRDYVAVVSQAETMDGVAEAAAESLGYMGEGPVEMILSILPESTETGKDLFCDILSGAAFDERIAGFLRERFLCHPENRALYASYLAKYADEGALPMLISAAKEPAINYLDYIELANAIEQLGGERPPEREFAGDPFYESMKEL